MPLPGSTIVSRILDILTDISERVVVVGNYYKWMLEKHFEEKGYTNVTVIDQGEALGTGHAAKRGLEALPRSGDRVILVYGDLFFDTHILRDLAELEPPVVVGVRHREPWRFGVLDFDENMCLKRIIEKPPDAEPGSLVNAGIYLFDGETLGYYLEKIGLSPRGEYELTDAITLMAREECVRVHIVESYWADIGTPWEYLKAVRLLLELLLQERAGVEGEVEPGARLQGPVYVSREGVVRAGTIVEGPAWIEGEVGPLAHIRPYTVVLNGGFVGGFSQVKGSIVMEYAKIPHLNYVGDSIVGEKTNLGAGTITANLRFDHRTVKTVVKGRLVDTGLRKFGSVIGGYAQTGINVSLMPGVKVGAFSWVSPGLVVKRDVPDCVLYMGEEDMRELSRYGVECKPRTLPWKRE